MISLGAILTVLSILVVVVEYFLAFAIFVRRWQAFVLPIGPCAACGVQARRPHDGLHAGGDILGVFDDPAVMLVTAAQPANVDTVMVDGRVLKRGGKLTHLNVDQIAKEAGDASAALRKARELEFLNAALVIRIFAQPAGGFLPGWMAPHFLQVRAFSSAKNAS